MRSCDDPSSSDIQQFNLQFACAGNRLLSTAELYSRVKKWEKERSLIPNPIWCDHLRNLSASKRLRIGYLSQDLHNHPVGRFIKPLLEEHDRSKVEVIAISCGRYHDSQTKNIVVVVMVGLILMASVI